MNLRSTIACMLFLLAACARADDDAPAATTTATASDDAASIQAASRAFSDAYVRGDTAAIGALYTENAVLLPPSRTVGGRQAIKAYFAPGPNRRNVAHAMTSSDLTIENGTAVDVGVWSNTWSIGDQEPQEASAPYMVIWQKGDDGQWRIRYDMWHSAPR